MRLCRCWPLSRCPWEVSFEETSSGHHRSWQLPGHFSVTVSMLSHLVQAYWYLVFLRVGPVSAGSWTVSASALVAATFLCPGSLGLKERAHFLQLYKDFGSLTSFELVLFFFFPLNILFGGNFKFYRRVARKVQRTVSSFVQSY